MVENQNGLLLLVVFQQGRGNHILNSAPFRPNPNFGSHYKVWKHVDTIFLDFSPSYLYLKGITTESEPPDWLFIVDVFVLFDMN